jgi:hypothetical protein
MATFAGDEHHDEHSSSFAQLSHAVQHFKEHELDAIRRRE